MVNYPHELIYNAVVPVDSTRDANGHWVQTSPSAQAITLDCRSEPNDAGKTTTSEDGQQTSYGFEVFGPLSLPDLKNNTPVTVRDGERIIATGNVRGFFRGRFNVSFKL